MDFEALCSWKYTLCNNTDVEDVKICSTRSLRSSSAQSTEAVGTQILLHSLLTLAQQRVLSNFRVSPEKHHLFVVQLVSFVIVSMAFMSVGVVLSKRNWDKGTAFHLRMQRQTEHALRTKIKCH